MIKSRWTMLLGILPLAGALLSFTGCNDPVAVEEETAAAASKIEAAADAPEKGAKRERMGGKHEKMHGMRGGHGMPGMGPGFLLGAALRDLDLTEAQRTAIQTEMDALHASMPARPEKGAFDAHRAALAAAIRSGKIDESAIPAPPAPPKDRDTARVAKAIETLHATLTAEQRKQLVDAVGAKMDRPFDHERGRGKHGEGEGRGGRGGHGAQMGPMGHVLHGIELTDAQQEKVREAFEKMGPSEADREAMKARHEAFQKQMKDRLQTFASDTFDAKTFVAMPADAPMFGPEMGPAKMVKALAIVVPILDDAQRTELANRIAEGPVGDGPGHAACDAK